MKISLNGKWKYKVDSNAEGMKEQWFSTEWYSDRLHNLPEISLPNNWNIIPELDRYEGIIWFFYVLEDHSTIRVNFHKSDLFIEFKAVNYHTHLWVNGHDCGIHEGNFQPFRFRVKKKMYNQESKNYFIVRVENFREKDRIPTLSRDWFNWGGIYRDITLLVLDKCRIKWVGITSNVHNNKKAILNVKCELLIPKDEKSIPTLEENNINWKLYYLGDLSTNCNEGKEQSKSEVIKSGNWPILNGKNSGQFSIQLEEAKRWTPITPYLYKIDLSLGKSEEPYIVRFGIRTVDVKEGKIHLNNRPISLHGVSLHEELLPYGRAIPKEARRRDVLNVKELGFNALRTGHYPHDESVYEICDEEGLLIFEEIPVYWGINFSNKKVLRLAIRMFHSMIRRDFNHPCIILWSAGNEIPVLNRSCLQFMTVLLRYGKKIDESRLFSCALEFWTSLVTPKSFIDEVDVLCCNEYIGWYYLSVYNLNFFLDNLKTHTSKKPWIITEFGAGAKYGNHDSAKIPAKFSEERQVSIIKHSIQVMNSKTYISGWFIWMYRDFRSHMRLNPAQKGFNRKGIVSEVNQRKKISNQMPSLVNRKLPEKEMKQHYISVVLFYWLFYPIIFLTSIIVSLILGQFSDSGNRYYLSKPKGK